MIPSNAFASVALTRLSVIVNCATVPDDSALEGELRLLSKEMQDLGDEVQAAVWEHGVVDITNADGARESVFAYEVDGFGALLILTRSHLSPH